MRILHVFKDYYPPTRGGIEQHLHELVHSLDGLTCEVLTAARSRRGSIEVESGVPVIRAAEFGRISTSPVTPSWASVFRRTSADVVHFHMPNPFGELAFLAAHRNVPLVATYHADIVGRNALRPGFVPIQRAFLRRAERIVVASPAMAETPALESHRDRLVPIPYGVDADTWAPRPEAADAIKQRHPGPLVLFLGRLVPYKGVELLIEAMRRVDATLLVVGDGQLRSRWEVAASNANLEERVVFVGEIADDARAAYYHAADVFALPSTTRAEAFGISILEAMACGTPAVSTELGTGTSFINAAGETGLVVPPRSAEALADALNALLSDGARRAAMGAAAAQRVREHFKKSEMLDVLADLYRSLQARTDLPGAN
jgi:glycosyltransferase involved in cell wall biosynthesis